MYRCTECKTVYEELPEFCDCGNDEFEEIADEVYYDEDDDEEEYVPPRPKKRKLTREELEELAEEKRDRIKALITACLSVLISVIIIVCPPYPQKKADKVAQSAEKVQYSKLPSVDTYWDKTLPSYARSNDKYRNLPLLNEHFGDISSTLKGYLANVGNEFNRRWETGLVKGNGEAKIAFVIDKEGRLEFKQLMAKSNNESLDDSILLLLSKVNEFEVPPDDYKGEKIVLSFSIKDGMAKVFYPSKV